MWPRESTGETGTRKEGSLENLLTKTFSNYSFIWSFTVTINSTHRNTDTENGGRPYSQTDSSLHWDSLGPETRKEGSVRSNYSLRQVPNPESFTGPCVHSSFYCLVCWKSFWDFTSFRCLSFPPRSGVLSCRIVLSLVPCPSWYTEKLLTFIFGARPSLSYCFVSHFRIN